MRGRLTLCLLLTAAAPSIACVGDDPSPAGERVAPDPGVPAGHYRGACADGKCLVGLSCIQGVCLYADFPDGGHPPAPEDGGTDGGDGAARGPRLVFTTKAVLEGNFGGVAGADQKCTDAASASALPELKGRSFLALISTPTSAARDRILDDGRELRCTGGAGERIAGTWNQFFSDVHEHPIDCDENGQRLSGTPTANEVWTGSTPTGAYAPSSGDNDACSAFTSASGHAYAGKWSASNSDWAAAHTNDNCSSKRHLYCVAVEEK